MFARFPFALRRFAKRKLTPARARELIRHRMETRGDSLIDVLTRSVFSRPGSPYLALLKSARCELGDVRNLVAAKGVEGALRELREGGVYVRFEEFKGRTPIVRDGLELPVSARDFDNPAARRDFTISTGGSTGLPTLVAQDLDYIADKSPIQMLLLEAHGLIDAPAAHWMDILPGTGFRFLLQRAHLGQWSEHWFSSIGWKEHREWPRFTAATYYMVASARAAGLPIPFPEFVRLEDATIIAKWVSDTVARHGRCMLACNVSHAMRVAIAARDAGLSIAGATFRIGGEPVTTAKAEFLRRAGAKVIAGYGMVEVSNIALGCPNGADAGDVHVSMDTMALIAHPHTIAETEAVVPAFLLTTLSDSSGKLMLNVQVDDCGIVEERSCGCEFEKCGMTIHLREITSYTKLVGEGVTLVGNEMIRILEEFLPNRFGGTPLDYQLVEAEDEQHLTRLYLTISPRVKIDDEHMVVEAVHDALTASSAAAGVASVLWKQGGTIRIRRAEPVWTARGKLMPLHIERYSAQRDRRSASSAAEA
jgi:hypothetical protein